MKKKTLLEDVLKALSRCFVVLIFVVIIGIALSGARVIKSGEVALVLRFGKLVGDTPEEQIHRPGLLVCFPYFIDEVITVPVDSVIEQEVTTHFTAGEIDNWSNSGYVITGDQNIALISASVKYVISDPVAYALYNTETEMMINASVSNAMLEFASSAAVDDILTSGKEVFARSVIDESQRKIDSVGLGITLQSVELTNVSMPEEVREIYENVNAATVEASTLMEEAQQYKNVMLPRAESEATATVTTANNEYVSAISAATAETAEFWGVLDEYLRLPDVVKARIFNDKMSKALSNIGKIRLVDDSDSKIFIDWE